MVNLNSVGRSVYVLSNILMGIKQKRGNFKDIVDDIYNIRG